MVDFLWFHYLIRMLLTCMLNPQKKAYMKFFMTHAFVHCQGRIQKKVDLFQKESTVHSPKPGKFIIFCSHNIHSTLKAHKTIPYNELPKRI